MCIFCITTQYYINIPTLYCIHSILDSIMYILSACGLNMFSEGILYNVYILYNYTILYQHYANIILYSLYLTVCVRNAHFICSVKVYLYNVCILYNYTIYQHYTVFI